LAENEGESLVDTMSTANTMTSGLDCSSPESIMEPTNRTPAGDQYSLGCTLYYALAGHYPFPEGTTVEKMMAHQFKTPTSLRELVAGVPEGLITIIERLMQKAPEARYNGADELVDALHHMATETGSSREPAPQFANRLPPQRATEPAARSVTPASSPGGLPLPPLPKQPTPIQASTFSATPATAPAAPVMPRQAPPQPQAAAPAKTLPTRQSVVQPVQPPPPPAIDTAPPPVSANHSPAYPIRRFEGTAPGWVPETQTRGGFGMLLIVMVAALVTILVYYLGKNFLFPNP
jgi:serine/threonine protein kinase